MEVDLLWGLCWVEGLNQINQRLPGHHLVHLSKEFLPSDLPVGGSLLIMTKAQLTAYYPFSLGMRFHPYGRIVGFFKFSLEVSDEPREASLNGLKPC